MAGKIIRPPGCSRGSLFPDAVRHRQASIPGLIDTPRQRHMVAVEDDLKGFKGWRGRNIGTLRPSGAF